MDIVITIPKTIDWSLYEKELQKVKSKKEEMLFRVNKLPKNTMVGERCYLCYDGKVLGWMEITNIYEDHSFECTTTSISWPKGNYIARSGNFHLFVDEQIKMKGFQGFRYAPDSWQLLRTKCL